MLINNSEFLLKEIPNFNPVLEEYEHVEFWSEQIKRNIEGYWVSGKWMPGPLYDFGNFHRGLVKSDLGNQEIGQLIIRDNDWEDFLYYEECRGFSGFELDEEFSCHRALIDPDETDETIVAKFCWSVKNNSRIPLYYNNIFKPDGTRKKYVPVRDYLRKFHFKSLGCPIYRNHSQNFVSFQARQAGKTMRISSMARTNFLYGGANNYANYLELMRSGNFPVSQTIMGAENTGYIATLAGYVRMALENMPGAYGNYAGEYYGSPLYLPYEGAKKLGDAEGFSNIHGSRLQTRIYDGNPLAANSGRPNLAVIDEFGFIKQPDEIFASLMGSQASQTVKTIVVWCIGCVCAGSKVWDNEGNLINIEDLDPTKGIIGFDEEARQHSQEEITYWQPPQEKDCYRITTNFGKTLECSDDHPILIKDKIDYTISSAKRNIEYFKETKDLKIGDRIAILEEVPIWSNKEMFDPRLIGWLVGDGTYGSSVQLINADPEMLEYVKANYKTRLSYSAPTKDGRTLEKLKILGINQELRKLGLYTQTRDNKRLPKDIHSYSKETICKFLGGYLDADGCAYSKNGKKPIIKLTSANIEILKEVQLLYQKLGIHAKLSYEKPNFNNPSTTRGHYNLVVSDRKSYLKFASCIEFSIKYKQEQVLLGVSILQNKKDKIAKESSGLRYERLVKLEYIGKKPVYNLTAGTTHTYVANGIVTHNTGGAVKGESVKYAEKLFYNPSEYGCLEFDDTWEFRGRTNNKIGNFVPITHTSWEYKDAPNYITNVERGVVKEKKERNKRKNNKSALEGYMINSPLLPSECFLLGDNSRFPSLLLKEQLSQLQHGTQQHFLEKSRKGELKFNEADVVEFKDDPNAKPIREYPFVGNDAEKKGCVEIWEMPVTDDNNEIPARRYGAGIDPVDLAQGESLACIWVKDLLTQRLVAKYLGRTTDPKYFYEQCRRLLIFYNAKALHENNLSGLFTYFEQERALRYLVETPSHLKSKEHVETGNTAYGYRNQGKLNDDGIDGIISWLLQPIDSYTDDLMYTTVKDPELLLSMIKYTEKNNWDSISALIALTHYENSLVKTKKDEHKERNDFASRYYATRKRDLGLDKYSKFAN